MSFGGDVQNYAFSEQFVYASSENPTLQKGDGCVGETTTDPLGATFDGVYNGTFYYVVWNDQFYDDPVIKGCSTSCGAPWGHSKGMLAWNDAGEGLVMQVTTPSWPAAGSKRFPRATDGNTLGCVDDDNVKVSQHFLALKLEGDLVNVFKAQNAASSIPLNRRSSPMNIRVSKARRQVRTLRQLSPYRPTSHREAFGPTPWQPFAGWRPLR